MTCSMKSSCMFDIAVTLCSWLSLDAGCGVSVLAHPLSVLVGCFLYSCVLPREAVVVAARHQCIVPLKPRDCRQDMLGFENCIPSLRGGSDWSTSRMCFKAASVYNRHQAYISLHICMAVTLHRFSEMHLWHAIGRKSEANKEHKANTKG